MIWSGACGGLCPLTPTLSRPRTPPPSFLRSPLSYGFQVLCNCPHPPHVCLPVIVPILFALPSSILRRRACPCFHVACSLIVPSSVAPTEHCRALPRGHAKSFHISTVWLPEVLSYLNCVAARYLAVLDACALVKDIQSFAAGDASIIGTRCPLVALWLASQLFVPSSLPIRVDLACFVRGEGHHRVGWSEGACITEGGKRMRGYVFACESRLRFGLLVAILGALVLSPLPSLTKLAAGS